MQTLSAPAVHLSAATLSQHTTGELLRLEWLAAAAIGLRLAGAVRQWPVNVQARHALARMGEREWRDLGLSRGEVLREASKPFWMC